MSDADDQPPAPLAEASRRAYLEAMGIPLWVPRDAAAAPAPEPASPEPVPPERAAPERDAPAAAEADGPPAGGAEEPPPLEPEEIDALAARATPDDDAGGSAPAPAAPAEVAALGWDGLRDTILGCTACELCSTRTQAVPGVGNAVADLLIIGEAPGQEEDRRGEPFVGRAGQLLDRMLAAIGLDRDTVYITNVLKCRPPRNRDPRPEEVQACAPYLRRQIELIAPRAILSVGRVSAQSLLETGDSIGRLRGRWHRFGPRDTPLLVTYHPAYLLRNPVDKRKAWDDLKSVRDRLRG